MTHKKSHSGQINRSDLVHFSKWIIGFSILAMLLYSLSESMFFNAMVEKYYAPLTVFISSFILRIIGVDHTIVNNTLDTGIRVFTVSNACTGIFVFLLLGGVMMFFPASWKDRGIGIISGLFILLALNVLRIVLIVTVGNHYSQSIWWFHVVIGQIMVISGTVLYFIFWLHTLNTRHLRMSRLFKEKIIRISFLFLSGYGVGTMVYHFFLQSPLGHLIEMSVQNHSLWIIGLLSKISVGLFSTSPFPHIRFNTGCLSSPVIVVLIAVLTCLPISWKKKLFFGGIGFIPVFYGYHLMRAVLTAASFAVGNSRETSVIYNCYGQFFLLFIGIILMWYHENTPSPDRFFISFKRAVTGLVAGCAAGIAGGRLFNHTIIPLLFRVGGFSQTDYYNHQLTISTMPYFQLFAVFVLIWSRTGSPWLKIVQSGFGIILLYLFMIFLTGTIQGFHLFPHIGILKFAIILVPFLIYMLLTTRPVTRLIQQKKQPASTGKSV